jgi:predicted nucleic acid-binding protein
MNAVVVDASVVAAAFFQEAHAEPAQKLLASNRELHAPDLLYAEVGNIIWKRKTRGEIDDAEAAELLADLLRLPLRITPCSELVEPALQLALRTGRTVYDCLYVAAALRHKTAVVSADKRLVNALAHGPLAAHVVWIGEEREV